MQHSRETKKPQLPFRATANRGINTIAFRSANASRQSVPSRQDAWWRRKPPKSSRGFREVSTSGIDQAVGAFTWRRAYIVRIWIRISPHQLRRGPAFVVLQRGKVLPVKLIFGCYRQPAWVGRVTLGKSGTYRFSSIALQQVPPFLAFLWFNLQHCFADVLSSFIQKKTGANVSRVLHHQYF